MCCTTNFPGKALTVSLHKVHESREAPCLRFSLTVRPRHILIELSLLLSLHLSLIFFIVSALQVKKSICDSGAFVPDHRTSDFTACVFSLYLTSSLCSLCLALRKNESFFEPKNAQCPSLSLLPLCTFLCTPKSTALPQPMPAGSGYDNANWSRHFLVFGSRPE